MVSSDDGIANVDESISVEVSLEVGVVDRCAGVVSLHDGIANVYGAIHVRVTKEQAESNAGWRTRGIICPDDRVCTYGDRRLVGNAAQGC